MRQPTTLAGRLVADGIHEVHEAMDTVAMLEFIRGEEVGAGFASLLVAQAEP